MGLFKSYSEKEVKRVMPLVKKINELEAEIEKLTDKELQAKTPELKEKSLQMSSPAILKILTFSWRFMFF